VDARCNFRRQGRGGSSRSFERPRSEAGRDFSIEPGFSSRLLYLDVRRLLQVGSQKTYFFSIAECFIRPFRDDEKLFVADAL
jgi:hypothetical protein